MDCFKHLSLKDFPQDNLRFIINKQFECTLQVNNIMTIGSFLNQLTNYSLYPDNSLPITQTTTFLKQLE